MLSKRTPKEIEGTRNKTKKGGKIRRAGNESNSCITSNAQSSKLHNIKSQAFLSLFLCACSTSTSKHTQRAKPRVSSHQLTHTHTLSPSQTTSDTHTHTVSGFSFLWPYSLVVFSWGRCLVFSPLFCRPVSSHSIVLTVEK